MNDWLVYVIGYPGCGKTTAMRKAIGWDDILDQEVENKPFAHTIYPSGLVEIGKAREPYGGTDTLALNVQPAVVKWLAEIDVPVVVGEGDRLANKKFFDSVANKGRHLAIVHIKCSELIARKRAWERGSRFNESWLKGRISKVDSLVEWYEGTDVLHTLDGGANPVHIGNELKSIIEGLNG